MNPGLTHSQFASRRRRALGGADEDSNHKGRVEALSAALDFAGDEQEIIAESIFLQQLQSFPASRAIAGSEFDFAEVEWRLVATVPPLKLGHLLAAEKRSPCSSLFWRRRTAVA